MLKVLILRSWEIRVLMVPGNLGPRAAMSFVPPVRLVVEAPASLA